MPQFGIILHSCVPEVFEFKSFYFPLMKAVDSIGMMAFD